MVGGNVKRGVHWLAAFLFGAMLGMAAVSAAAANLVLNPSFETITNCPTQIVGSPSDFAIATSWSMPTLGSPDVFNACGGLSSSVNVPANSFGNQAARTGVGYAGFRLFSATIADNYREYIQGSLASPLVAGVLYDVSYYVSLADPAILAVPIANIDLHFSVGAVGFVNSTLPLNLTPQVVHAGAPIADTVNWVQISGTYLAVGGETNFTIGNFRTDANTNAIVGSGTRCCAYYYLDDVSVEARSTGTVPEPSMATLLALLAAMGFATTRARRAAGRVPRRPIDR